MGDILPANLKLDKFGIIFSLVCGLTYLTILGLAFDAPGFLLSRMRIKKSQRGGPLTGWGEKKADRRKWLKESLWQAQGQKDVEKGD